MLPFQILLMFELTSLKYSKTDNLINTVHGSHEVYILNNSADSEINQYLVNVLQQLPRNLFTLENYYTFIIHAYYLTIIGI